MKNLTFIKSWEKKQMHKAHAARAFSQSASLIKNIVFYIKYGFLQSWIQPS